jgi:hypothetical protein
LPEENPTFCVEGNDFPAPPPFLSLPYRNTLILIPNAPPFPPLSSNTLASLFPPSPSHFNEGPRCKHGTFSINDEGFLAYFRLENLVMIYPVSYLLFRNASVAQLSAPFQSKSCRTAFLPNKQFCCLDQVLPSIISSSSSHFFVLVLLHHLHFSLM